MSLVWIDGNGVFKRLKSEEVSNLEEGDIFKYKDAESEDYLSQIKQLKEKGEGSSKELSEMSIKLDQVRADLQKLYTDKMTKMGEEINRLKNLNPKSKELKAGLSKFKQSLLKAEQDLSVLKKKGAVVELKADVGYSDLTHTGQLDQLESGISDMVKKTPVIWSLFKKTPMVTETYSYMEQTSVVRNAQGVAVCAKSFSSFTKEELGMRRINYVKIKDTVDICRDYADDFTFVYDRYRVLINDSIAFLVDTQILLGTNTQTSTNSINNVASEFDPANVNAPIGATIQSAQMVDLLLGMQAQIETLGKLAYFMPNVVLVNRMDWFKNVESLKDDNNNYLDTRVTRDGRFFRLNGMLVIPHVEVVANTCHVFDSSKGEILDRMQSTLRISDENGTNFVDEFTTMMAIIKLQFMVKTNNADAFMKCSDINTAIGAITKL